MQKVREIQWNFVDIISKSEKNIYDKWSLALGKIKILDVMRTYFVQILKVP